MVVVVTRRAGKVERILIGIAERQKISRLDTAMFLLYPLCLTGSIWLWSTYNQIAVYREIKILGISFDVLIFYVSLFFIFGIAFSFLLYLRAYLADSMMGRVRSCNVLTGESVIFVSVMTIPVGAQIRQLAAKASDFAWMGDLVQILLGTAAGLFWDATVVWKLQRKVAVWIADNVPQRLKEAKLRLEPNRTMEKRRNATTKGASLLWVGVLILYGAAIVDVWIRAPSPIPEIGYHVATLIAGVLLTFALWLKLTR
jgi:hypothetical protein